MLFSIIVAEIKVGDEAPTYFVRDLTENYFFSDTLTLIPEYANVILEIYSINSRLGNELQNSYMQSGYHSISWDANM